MATDAIAFVGMPPPAVGPPDAAVSTGGTQGGDGEPFSRVIAKAIDGSNAPAESADASTDEAVTTPSTGTTPGIDLAQLLATVLGQTGQAVTGEQAVPELVLAPEVDRPDRDAEAENMAASIAALMLGGVVAQPVQATPVIEGGIAAAPAAVASVTGAPSTVSEASGAAVMPSGIVVQAADVEQGTSTDVPASQPGPVSEYGWQPFTAPAPVQQPKPQTANATHEAPAALAVGIASTPVGAADVAPATDVPAETGEVTSMSVSQEPATADAPRIEVVSTDELPAERTTERGDISATSNGALAAVTPYAQAATPVRAADAPVVTAVVDASSGPALARGLADTVHAASLRGDHELKITLNPPDLGQLTVHITEHNSGGVTVAIQASSHEAHDLLQQQLPALRAGLEQREVRVERLQVEQQASSAGLGWAGNGQQQSNQREAWASRDEQEWSPIAAMGGVRATASSAPRTRVVEDGRVDVRA